jgi:hypothetical protein
MIQLGGKTKFGAILIVAGLAIAQTVDLCPLAGWIPWIKWLGGIISIIGTYFGIVGIGGKLDKNTEAVQAVGTVDCEEKPMTATEFRQILNEAAKKRAATKT